MTGTDNPQVVASIIMAAGRGSRMKGYTGNKTVLPLVPETSLFDGQKPIIRHLFEQLPGGPKAVIVNHCKADVMHHTADTEAVYIDQPVLNGTGGAILAATEFLETTPAAHVVITMGDVPFVRQSTYARLVAGLDACDLMILGFAPADKKQYGILEIEGGQVKKITEWKYWRDYPADRQAALTVCNSGIYAVRRKTLAHYLPILAPAPRSFKRRSTDT